MVFYSGHAIGVWYVAESTEGTTPTSASFLNLAQRADVVLTDEPNPQAVTKSGSVDKTSFSKGVENPRINLTFTPSQASGAAFIKNYISSDTSFTLLLMIDAASDTIFARVTGCKVKRMSSSVSIYPDNTPLNVTCEIWGGAISYSVSGGSPTFESAPSSIVNYSDITIKKTSTTITQWWNFEWTLENELYRQPSNTGATTTIVRGIRNITGSWQIPAENVGQTELDEAKNATAIELHFLILTDDYDFDSCAYTSVDISHPITNVVGKKMDFTVGNLTIT